MTTSSTSVRAKCRQLADYAAIAVALTLPWSISATGICVAAWLVFLIPTLDRDAIRQEFRRPAAWLPVALLGLALIGLLWSPVVWKEKLRAAEDFLRLALVGLLFIQFRRSERGHWVLVAFLFSGAVLLLVSWLSLLVPGIGKSPGIPVKDYISQSAVFTLCAFALLYLGFDVLRARRIGYGLLILALSLPFFANMFFVVTSRTALLTIPFLMALLGYKFEGWRGAISMSAIGSILAVLVWLSSDNVRARIGGISGEVENYYTTDTRTSMGERLEFWRRSAVIMSGAPLMGHGTGATREMFRRSADGQSGLAALVTANPHNQTFAIGIQLGLVGIALLYAMWIAHLMLFRDGGIAAWIGLLVVVQSMIGSLANSHLFDATHAWIYIFGVGVAGGIVSRQSGQNALDRPLPFVS